MSGLQTIAEKDSAALHSANRRKSQLLTEAAMLLEECDEYFADKGDAWTDEGVWVCNKEMRLSSAIRELLERIAA